MDEKFFEVYVARILLMAPLKHFTGLSETCLLLEQKAQGMVRPIGGFITLDGKIQHGFGLLEQFELISSLMGGHQQIDVDIRIPGGS